MKTEWVGGVLLSMMDKSAYCVRNHGLPIQGVTWQFRKWVRFPPPHLIVTTTIWLSMIQMYWYPHLLALETWLTNHEQAIFFQNTKLMLLHSSSKCMLLMTVYIQTLAVRMLWRWTKETKSSGYQQTKRKKWCLTQTVMTETNETIRNITNKQKLTPLQKIANCTVCLPTCPQSTQ